MNLIEIFFISFALGLDAFSIAVAAGAYFRKATKSQKFRLSFHFGLFQFMMPIIGWYGGASIEKYISSFDHWIVMTILTVLGAKMIHDGLKSEDNSIKKDISKGYSLIALAVATSIDAMAIGFSLALINVDIFFISVIIGIVAAIMTLIGIKIGEKASSHFNGKAFIFGGVILILIGLNILYQHIF